jgi:cytochrome c553
VAAAAAGFGGRDRRARRQRGRAFAGVRRAKASLQTALGLSAILLVAPAHAQPDTLYVRTLAANCAQCHGTDGHPAAGSGMPALAGRAREDLLAQLKAFKAGTRASTIMQQLARGYSDVQLEQLAAFFAAQKP